MRKAVALLFALVVSCSYPTPVSRYLPYVDADAAIPVAESVLSQNPDFYSWGWVADTRRLQAVADVVWRTGYRPDPDSQEVIQSPLETWERPGGDCEDLSILLVSTLRAIGYTGDLYMVSGTVDGEAHVWSEVYPSGLLEPGSLVEPSIIGITYCPLFEVRFVEGSMYSEARYVRYYMEKIP